MERIFRLNCNTGRNFIEFRSADIGHDEFLRLEITSCGRAYSRGGSNPAEDELVDRHFLEIKEVLVAANDMVGLASFLQNTMQDVKSERGYELVSPEGFAITFLLKKCDDVVIEFLKNTLSISMVSLFFRTEIVLIVELTVLTAAFEDLNRWIRGNERMSGHRA